MRHKMLHGGNSIWEISRVEQGGQWELSVLIKILRDDRIQKFIFKFTVNVYYFLWIIKVDHLKDINNYK